MLPTIIIIKYFLNTSFLKMEVFLTITTMNIPGSFLNQGSQPQMSTSPGRSQKGTIDELDEQWWRLWWRLWLRLKPAKLLAL
jgi:hypothetical protein